MSFRNTPDYRHTRQARIMESVVPYREHLVPQPYHIPQISPDRLMEEVGFPPLRIDMRMSSEERHERAGLVPSNQHLWWRIAEKAANIRSAERHADNVVREEHGCLTGEMFPCTGIIACPDRPIPMRSSEEAPRQDEWPFCG